MEDDDIYDVLTESERGEKIITPRRNKGGRQTKAEGLNMHKSDVMQTIPELLEKGKTSERENDLQQEIKRLIREGFSELRREMQEAREESNREILSWRNEQRELAKTQG